MMGEQTYRDDDEISLLDIYEFLKEGWKTIATTTALGTVIGLGTGLSMPEKFEAKSLIQSGKVLGSDVETASVLREKMRSPTYYSQQTITACDLLAAENSAETLITALKLKIEKESVLVAVSYKSKDINTSVACLNAVLEDVKKNQNELAQRQIDLAKLSLERDKRKLKIAEDFVSSISKKGLTLDFKDTQFSVSQLSLATLQTRQTEIMELTSSIQKTELLLTEPHTKPASFITPIYGPNIKVEPNRSRIAIIGILAGGFSGLMFLFLRRVVKKIREESTAREMG